MTKTKLCAGHCEDCVWEAGEWCFDSRRIPTHVALMRAMDEKGITPRELSELSGVSYSQVMKMLSSNMAGSLETWLKVLKPLGMTVDEITGQKRSEPPWNSAT